MAARKVNTRKQKLANERAQRAGFRNDYELRKYLKKYAPRPDLAEREWLDVLKGTRGAERRKILLAHNTLYGPLWKEASDFEKATARKNWADAKGDTKRLAEMKGRGYTGEGDWERARATAADIDIRYMKHLTDRVNYLLKAGLNVPEALAAEYEEVLQMIEEYPEFLDDEEE